MSVITLTLLLPGKTVPVQNWTFETESVIRIGRAADNDVVLYSAVVSRHHLELRRGKNGWEAVNIGANGTYINGEPVSNVAVADGMTIRLASSGPKIQISIEADANSSKPGISKAQKDQSLITQTPHDPTKETVIS